MNDYAIVMTCSGNLIVCACAAFNGLEIYGTKADVHLLTLEDIDKSWLGSLPSNFTVVSIRDLFDKELEATSCDGPKSDHWRCEFYRYKYSATLKGRYKAVCIIDADMFIVNCFNEYFAKAVGNKNMIMPKNPMGMPLDFVLKNGVDQIQSACSPTYANMPIFFDPNIHSEIMNKTFLAGLRHPYGDMQMLFRTMIEENVHNNVELTEDGLWVRNVWFDTKLECRFDDKLLSLYEEKDGALERVYSVHQRWALFSHRDQRMKIIRGDIPTGGQIVPLHTSIAHWNIALCWFAIQWLLANGSIKPPKNTEKYLYSL